MRATYWLIGCALCLVGIGSVAATNLDTQEQDSAQRTTSDSAISHDGNNSGGGDVLGLTHDTPSRNSASNSGNSNDRSGGTPSAPAPSRQPHLGWQSLLPGSIQ